MLMMNNTSPERGFSTISLVVTLGAAVVLGVGTFLLTRTTSPAGSPASTAETIPGDRTASDELTGRELTTTIPDIVGRGQSLACDWKLPVEAGESPFNHGKLWTTDSKGRSTMSADISGMVMEAHAVYQGNTAYTWMLVGDQKIGMKFSPSELDAMSSSMTAQERQQAEQISRSMRFNCQPWSPDETKFILPSDVDFRDM